MVSEDGLKRYLAHDGGFRRLGNMLSLRKQGQSGTRVAEWQRGGREELDAGGGEGIITADGP